MFAAATAATAALPSLRLPSVALPAPPEDRCCRRRRRRYHHHHPCRSLAFPPALPSRSLSSPSPDRRVLHLATPAIPLAFSPLFLSLSLSFSLLRSLAHRVELNPLFARHPTVQPATQRNQTRAASRVRRGAVLPRMAEATAALLGLCPVFASSCVPADRTLHPPIGTHNSPARTRILSCAPAHDRSLYFLVSFPVLFAPPPNTQHSRPSSNFHPHSPPLLFVHYLPFAFTCTVSLSSFARSCSPSPSAEVPRSPPFGSRRLSLSNRVVLSIPGLGHCTRSRISCTTAGNVAEICRRFTSSSFRYVRGRKGCEG